MRRSCLAPRLWDCVAALLVAAGAGCTSTTRNASLRPDSAPPPPGSTLAIVPFENLSTSRNAGLAVTDLAASVLYAHPYFQVVEVSRLQDDPDVRFRKTEVAPWERQIGLNTAAAAAVGRALKTDYVLAGSVGEYGFVDGFGETATVGFNVRLVHSAEADVIWAGSLSRRVNTVAFSQESVHRLAHQVLQDLLGQMIRDLTRHPPAHAEAGK